MLWRSVRSIEVIWILKSCWNLSTKLGPLSTVLVFPFDNLSAWFFPVFGVSLGFPGGSAGKESACNVQNLGSIPGLGRSPGEGKGYPLQYSGLENSMDSPWGHKESDRTERLSLLVFPDHLFILKCLYTHLLLIIFSRHFPINSI